MKKVLKIFAVSLLISSCVGSDLIILKNNMKDSLLGYWSFDDDKLVDSSPYKNNALNNDAIIDNGIIENSIDLSKNLSFVNIQDQKQYKSINKTIMFWFYKNTPTINETYGLKNVEGIIGKAPNTGVNREFSIAISGEAYPFTIYSNVGLKNKSLITTGGQNLIYPQKWYHVALVISMQKIQFYLNSELVGSNSIEEEPILNNSDIYIGKAAKNFKSTRYFNGKIDELYIYDQVLTKAEISEFYSENSKQQ